MKINFTVYGKPISYKRVIPVHGGIPYNPKSYVAYCKHVRQIASLFMNEKPTSKPISVKIIIFHPVKASSRMSGDIDNHCKAILDSLNGVVFVDDGQVIHLEAAMFKDKINPRVEIFITDEF